MPFCSSGVSRSCEVSHEPFVFSRRRTAALLLSLTAGLLLLLLLLLLFLLFLFNHLVQGRDDVVLHLLNLAARTTQVQTALHVLHLPRHVVQRLVLERHQV